MAEKERKFVLRHFPRNLGKGVKIRQGYIISREEVEMRIRQKGNKYFQCVKGGGDLSRPDWEPVMPKWVFDLLWPRTEGLRIMKMRYPIPMRHLTFEFDRFMGVLSLLRGLEIEFETEKEAKSFVLPPGIDGVDVTYDKRFKNKNLAKLGSEELKVLLDEVLK